MYPASLGSNFGGLFELVLAYLLSSYLISLESNFGAVFQIALSLPVISLYAEADQACLIARTTPGRG